MKLGIIAEDYSDVAILKHLTTKLLRSKKVGFKQFVGHGCGKLRRKCRAWADNLIRQGCSWIVVAHDLDQNNETLLRTQLENEIACVAETDRIVLIPIREIEAWLLFDANAICAAFKERACPHLPSSPESLIDPKKELGEIVWHYYKKEYMSTIHNELIAQNISLNKLCRARSFSKYPLFIKNVEKHAIIRY
jgi:hypothetical protein